jgi:hypothetical protein
MAPPGGAKSGDEYRGSHPRHRGAAGDALRALRCSPSCAERRRAGKVADLMAADRLDIKPGVAAQNPALCPGYHTPPTVSDACGCNVITAVAETLDMAIKLIETSAEEPGTGEVLFPQRGVIDDVTIAANTSAGDHLRADLTAACAHPAPALALTGLVAAADDAGGGV